MRPNGQSLITKGLQGIGKAISLATKGILDRITVLVRRGGQPYRRAFDWFFKIVGKKLFVFEIVYEIIGKKQIEAVANISLVGQKQTLIEIDYLIKAVLEKQLSSILQLSGKKSFDTEKQLVLCGVKRFELAQNLNVAGIKDFSFSLERPILARRSFPIMEKKELIGSKTIDINNTIKIKGKQDTTPILVALDIL